jgi:hypothetical protein
MSVLINQDAATHNCENFRDGNASQDGGFERLIFRFIPMRILSRSAGVGAIPLSRPAAHFPRGTGSHGHLPTTPPMLRRLENARGVASHFAQQARSTSLVTCEPAEIRIFLRPWPIAAP